MGEFSEDGMTLVMRNTRDEQGTVYRAVDVRAGCLTIFGHDLGSGVEDFFGFGEYEFSREFDSLATSQLAQLLGVDSENLLPAINDRFTSTSELEKFAESNGLDSQFWSRVGD